VRSRVQTPVLEKKSNCRMCQKTCVILSFEHSRTGWMTVLRPPCGSSRMSVRSVSVAGKCQPTLWEWGPPFMEAHRLSRHQVSFFWAWYLLSFWLLRWYKPDERPKQPAPWMSTGTWDSATVTNCLPCPRVEVRGGYGMRDSWC
jgi:hypothetical protein